MALRALGTLAALPALQPLRALSAPKTLRVGVLFWGPQEYASRYFTPFFLDALRELGRAPGRGLELDWRFSDGDVARDALIAEEFALARLDAIVTAGSERTAIIRHAARSTPLIAHMEDPVGRGFAKSLQRPGGDVTGLTVEVEATATKQFALLRRVSPAVGHVVTLIDAVTATPELRAAPVLRAAKMSALTADWRVVDGLAGFERAFASLRHEKARAAYVVNTRQSTDISKLAAAAAGNGVATMSHYRVFVEQGGLMAYFVNIAEVGRRMAMLLDKVLRGARPGSIPFERPTRFDFVINRRTASQLGLEVPNAILLEANEVIG